MADEEKTTADENKNHNYGSHSTIRKGESDYHDGGDGSLYLGNDESENPDMDEGSEKNNFDGKVAEGNQK